jgi:hypothetical protein
VNFENQLHRLPQAASAAATVVGSVAVKETPAVSAAASTDAMAEDSEEIVDLGVVRWTRWRRMILEGIEDLGVV